MFLNKVIDRLRAAVEFTLRAILKYFPTQNGAAERYVEEVKRMLVKILRGDLSSWERIIPVTQLSLNDRTLGRHGSSPFACMFVRKLNAARNYSDVEIDRTSVEELLERNKKMVEAVYPALEKRAAKRGEKQCSEKNKSREVAKKLPIKAVVMKKLNNHTSKMQQ